MWPLKCNQNNEYVYMYVIKGGKQTKTETRKFGLSTELINQIFVFHFPTDAAPQFLQKLTPLLNKNWNPGINSLGQTLILKLFIKIQDSEENELILFWAFAGVGA